MTNLEQYHRILKTNLRAKEEDLNDDVLVYNRFPKWDSVTHVDMVSDLEEKFKITFKTLDITSFSSYSAGIEILKQLGVDMDDVSGQ